MNNWTFVVRRVRNKPNFFKCDRVSSALFKDAKGVSVNRDDDRELTNIILDEERLHYCYLEEPKKETKEFKLKALVAVDREVIKEKEVLVVDAPLEENPHHAVLKKSETEIRLTDSQARALAMNSRFIKRYD